MRRLRLGAVSYLNTKPLVYGLDALRDLFTVRYDVPSQCATLLHQGHVDLGLIPSVEYLRGDYSMVPDVAIGSNGPIASVAIFSRVPIDRIRTLALDTSSRTSVVLTKILCAKRWQIAPTVVPSRPDIKTMLANADAALLIGDPALELDPDAHGVSKVDLGTEWHALTGLPFVFAVWAGRPGIATREHCEGLQAARDRGVANVPEIARATGRGDAMREARALHYLRDNLKYGFGAAEVAGLLTFHVWAVELGVAAGLKPLRFFEGR
ncbi:MAG: menaquinone biosynthetic enzyme MqnA/MqnD family protein [Vicinamibacterales bacterium]